MGLNITRWKRLVRWLRWAGSGVLASRVSIPDGQESLANSSSRTLSPGFTPTGHGELLAVLEAGANLGLVLQVVRDRGIAALQRDR